MDGAKRLGIAGAPGRFALPAWEFPTFWVWERLGGTVRPTLGRDEDPVNSGSGFGAGRFLQVPRGRPSGARG